MGYVHPFSLAIYALKKGAAMSQGGTLNRFPRLNYDSKLNLWTQCILKKKKINPACKFKRLCIRILKLL